MGKLAILSRSEIDSRGNHILFYFCKENPEFSFSISRSREGLYVVSDRDYVLGEFFSLDHAFEVGERFLMKSLLLLEEKIKRKELISSKELESWMKV